MLYYLALELHEHNQTRSLFDVKVCSGLKAGRASLSEVKGKRETVSISVNFIFYKNEK